MLPPGQGAQGRDLQEEVTRRHLSGLFSKIQGPGHQVWPFLFRSFLQRPARFGPVFGKIGEKSGRGAVRSAHWSGGPGVAGSNPAVPTIIFPHCLASSCDSMKSSNTPHFIFCVLTPVNPRSLARRDYSLWLPGMSFGSGPQNQTVDVDVTYMTLCLGRDQW